MCRSKRHLEDILGICESHYSGHQHNCRNRGQNAGWSIFPRCWSVFIFLINKGFLPWTLYLRYSARKYWSAIRADSDRTIRNAFCISTVGEKALGRYDVTKMKPRLWYWKYIPSPRITPVVSFRNAGRFWGNRFGKPATHIRIKNDHTVPW